MSDPAHEYTDEEIRRVERRLAREYKQAGAEIQQKMERYLERSAVNNEKKRQQVENGELSEEDYKKWLYGQTMVGQRWKEMRENLAVNYHNANLRAKGITDGLLPKVYAENFNYGTFIGEKQTKTATSFTLFSEDTVRKLAREEKIMLPKRDPAKAAENKDVKWNEKKVTSAILQGVLQGEPINKIAGRLQTVTVMNENAAVRNARTMMTAAQNAGRMDGLYRIREQTGIEIQKQWMATLDGRTRHSHRMLDGEIVDLDDAFSNKCQYPADPAGHPAEVYNCRCTLVVKIPDLENDDLTDMSHRNIDKLEQGYDDWKTELEKGGTGIAEAVVDRMSGAVTKQGEPEEEPNVIDEERQQEIDQALEYYVSGEGMYVNDHLVGKFEENGGEWGEMDEELLHWMDEGTQDDVKQKKLWRSVDASAVFGDMTLVEFEDMVDVLLYGEDTIPPASATKAKKRLQVEGKEITEPRFMSTTTNKELAMEWRDYTGSDKPIVLELDVPDGIKGADLERFDIPEDPQNEVLLARGQKYKVKSIGTEDGQIVVKVELIPEKKKRK